jgi:ABC-type amino acid transport substrate-binding protein
MPVGIPFPQDSPIIDIFNEVMEQFRANGIVERLTKKYISILEKDCTSPTVFV